MIVAAKFKESFVLDGIYTVLAVVGTTTYCVAVSDGNKFTSWSEDMSDLKKTESISHRLGSGCLSDYWPEELDDLEFLSDVWQENVDDIALVLVNKLEQKKQKQQAQKKSTEKTKDQANPLLGKFAVIIQSGMFRQVGKKEGGAFGHWSNPTGVAIEEEKEVKWGHDRFYYLEREWKNWTWHHDRGYSTNVVMNESEAIACYGDIHTCLKDLKERGFKVLVYVSDKRQEPKEGFDAVISKDDLWKEYFKESKKYVYLGMECILEKLITK